MYKPVCRKNSVLLTEKWCDLDEADLLLRVAFHLLHFLEKRDKYEDWLLQLKGLHAFIISAGCIIYVNVCALGWVDVPG